MSFDHSSKIEFMIFSNGMTKPLTATGQRGVFMFVAQVPAMAHTFEGDLGKAVELLALPILALRILSLASMVVIFALGIVFGRVLLSTASSGDSTATLGGRARFLLYTAFLPWLIGSILCVPFRVAPWDRAILPFGVASALVGLLWPLVRGIRSRDAVSEAAESPRWHRQAG